MRINNLNLSFNDIEIIRDISFDVKKGEFLSIVGRSGCGKTSLLYLILGFLEANSGSIEINGKKGFVFQDHNLFSWMTVKENIKVPLINQEKNPEDIEKISSELLKEVGLVSFEDHYPNQISEGMKQRVGIARALANNPEILIMDEPFSSLDYFTRFNMQDFILRLKEKHNLTIVFVTHDIDEAIKLSDRIIILSERPTWVVEVLEKVEFDKEKILDLINYSNHTISSKKVFK